MTPAYVALVGLAFVGTAVAAVAAAIAYRAGRADERERLLALYDFEEITLTACARCFVEVSKCRCSQAARA